MDNQPKQEPLPSTMTFRSESGRDVWVGITQHSAVAAVILLMLGLILGLMSGRLRFQLVEAAKLWAIYAVVVMSVKLPNELVSEAARLVAVFAVAPLTLVAGLRGEWVQVAMLAAAVVLMWRLCDGARQNQPVKTHPDSIS